MKRTNAGVSRRAWIKSVGAVAAGAALGTTGCADDAAGEDGSIDAGFGDADGGGGDSGGGVDTGRDAVTDAVSDAAADTPVGPPPALQPVRGDGSHPYHYIDNIVIVQMENRSFDHMFGARSLLEGMAEVDGLREGMSNTTSSGRVVPISLLSEDWKFDPDPSHSHSGSVEQWNGGANDGFVRNFERLLNASNYEEKIESIMGYYSRAQLPASYGLADSFTICDRWFCSVLGPTWPNRFFSHAASSDGQWGNDLALNAKTPYTYAMDAGLTFGVYHYAFYFFQLLVNDTAAGSYPHGDMDAFFTAAAEGTLPNITIVEPDYALNDDHPPHDVRLGQAFVQSVYEALRQSPQWERTLMVVLYDEHGGFFDHVAPPTTQGDEREAEGFGQLGFRVPGMLIGPLVKRGHVMHTVVDHSSVPALISRVFGLPFVNRRAELSGDFVDAFDLELTLDAARPAPPILPPLEFQMDKLRHALTLPSGQPELEAYARRHFGLDDGGFSGRMRVLERYLRQLERLRVATVRG